MKDAATRNPISKKLRFDVFKRDSFTCQYCGKMAPDVVLEVDHINPVKNKGTGDILNLVTSCYECNRGKGSKLLTENQVLKKQQEQLKELNEKRSQLIMMVEWKEELSRFSEDQVDIIDRILADTGRCLSSFGRNSVKSWITRFGFDEVYESTRLSMSQYYVDDKTLSKVIDYIPRICGVRQGSKNNEWFSKRRYIYGIIKNRMGIYNEKRLMIMLKSLVNDEVSYENVSRMAKDANNWSQFWKFINETYEGNF